MQRRHRSVQVTYRDAGAHRTRLLELAGTGTPIVCLHGFSDHADTRRPVMRALVRDVAGAPRVIDAIPHTELVTLHGHGHCPQLEIAPRVAG